MQLPKLTVRRPQARSSLFSCLETALTDLKIAMNAMSALINYLDLTRDQNNFGHFNFKQYTMGQYMRLDASAVQALSLLPNARETGGNKNMNLLGLLNKCKTAQGSRLVGQWLKQPLVNLHEISSYAIGGCSHPLILSQESDRTWSRFLSRTQIQGEASRYIHHCLLFVFLMYWTLGRIPPIYARHAQDKQAFPQKIRYARRRYSDLSSSYSCTFQLRLPFGVLTW